MNIYQTLSTTVLIVCGASLAHADVVDLAPGEAAGGLNGIMNTELSELIGTTESDILQDFTIFGTGGQGNILYQGTLMTRVVRSNETGNLHFNYRILGPNPQFGGMISRVELDGYSGLQTRVEYRSELSAPGDEGPVDASRSADGDVLTFDFGEILDPAEESRFFFAMVDTDVFTLPGGQGRGGPIGGATATIYLLTGESVTLTVPGAGPIPAPGAISVLSLAGLITVRRRR